MKKRRSKPCQHYRSIKTKKGKVRKLINKGVRRVAKKIKRRSPEMKDIEKKYFEAFQKETKKALNKSYDDVMNELGIKKMQPVKKNFGYMPLRSEITLSDDEVQKIRRKPVNALTDKEYLVLQQEGYLP